MSEPGYYEIQLIEGKKRVKRLTEEERNAMAVESYSLPGTLEKMYLELGIPFDRKAYEATIPKEIPGVPFIPLEEAMDDAA